ncbi:MAG: serine hydrolase domain-containing protein [Candidatus Nanopelagicales bacterium]
MRTLLITALATATMATFVPTAQGQEVSPMTAERHRAAQAATGQSFTATKKAGRKAIRAALRETGSSSASVALVSGRKTIWSQTFGRVDKAGRKPSPTTKFGIGSVSKMLTTMAVMQLVDEGKISLDSPVVRYVPDFAMLSPQYRQITVRMLLNHSAGFPGTNFSDLWSHQPIPSYVDGVLTGLANSHLKTTPGAMNVYCNDCFTMAGVVVERVSGMPFQDYVRANILEPLGMTHSTYPTSVPKPGTVAPIMRGKRAQPIELTNAFATGGMMSTSRDMARLTTVFTGDGVVAGRRILSSSAIQQMAVDETATTLKVGPRSFLRYGLGWDTVRDPALKSAGVLGWTKGGDTVDYHASFAIAPHQRLGAVVLGAGQGFSSIAAETVAQTVLLHALVETGAVKRLPAQVSGTPGKNQVTKAKAKRQIRKLSGIYLAQADSLKLTRTSHRSVKAAKLVDGVWVPSPGRFVLRNDGAFWSTKSPGTSIRSVQAWDRSYVVQRSIGGVGTYYSHIARGQKTRSGGALSSAWKSRVGKEWLLADESPRSLSWTLNGTPAVEIAAIPGLSGYLLAKGAIVDSVPFDATTSDSQGTMFLEIPLGFGRDLYDFEFTKRNGQEFLTFDSSVLRPAATVPTMSAGDHTVTFSADGWVEWRRLSAAAAVTLSGQSDWKLFDHDLSPIGSGGSARVTRKVPDGAYVAIFGAPHSSATVVVE